MKQNFINFLIFIILIIIICAGLSSIIFFVPANALAKDIIYTRKVTEIIDGDTIKVEMIDESDLIADLEYSIRISGIDTPEIKTSSKCEKELGLKAKEFLKNLILTDRYINIINPAWDKYGGRILAKLEVKGQSIGDIMIKNGYAIVYNGDKKNKIWCKD